MYTVRVLQNSFDFVSELTALKSDHGTDYFHFLVHMCIHVHVHFCVQMSSDGNWMHLLFQSRLQAKKVNVTLSCVCRQGCHMQAHFWLYARILITLNH